MQWNEVWVGAKEVEVQNSLGTTHLDIYIHSHIILVEAGQELILQPSNVGPA